MLYVTNEDVHIIAASLRDMAVACEDPEVLRERFLRVLGPLLRPMPRPARKVGPPHEASGKVLAEFQTLAGKRMVAFEYTLIPGLLHFFERSQVMVLPPE